MRASIYHSFPPVRPSTSRVSNRVVVLGLTAIVTAIVAWPVSIVLRKEVVLQNNPDPLKPGMGARGAYINTGSRDAGPDIYVKRGR
jgi:hypothetical protein